jgi:choline kinase
MKALILSAGQGKRLLPLTEDTPKCILPIMGQSLIEWQVDELAKCGINQVTVVVGYRADKVEQILRSQYDVQRVRTVYNAAYAISDNLVSCWSVHDEMDEDFVLLNGDTLFEAAVLQRLLDTPRQPVTVTVSQKSHYDTDDMKVSLDGCRLVKIGKDLPLDQVDAESIGMILFRDRGPTLFRNALEEALRNPSAQRKWYLSVIGEMARRMPVWTCSVSDLHWCEVDYPADLTQAEKVISVCAASGYADIEAEPLRALRINPA